MVIDRSKPFRNAAAAACIVMAILELISSVKGILMAFDNPYYMLQLLLRYMLGSAILCIGYIIIAKLLLNEKRDRFFAESLATLAIGQLCYFVAVILLKYRFVLCLSDFLIFAAFVLLDVAAVAKYTNRYSHGTAKWICDFMLEFSIVASVCAAACFVLKLVHYGRLSILGYLLQIFTFAAITLVGLAMWKEEEETDIPRQAPLPFTPVSTVVTYDAPDEAEERARYPDNSEQIRNYKKLMDDGIITQEEFEAKKKQLLGL